jgi:hypothetical protein
MKFLAVFTIALVLSGGTQASVFGDMLDKLAEAFKQTFHAVGDQLQTVVHDLAASAAASGVDLASQAIQRKPGVVDTIHTRLSHFQICLFNVPSRIKD